MKKIQGQLRNEYYMMSLEENIAEDDIVRVIDAVVDELDLKKLGFQKENKERKSNAGRPGYPDEVMLKMYILGYRMGVHSGRKLEDRCKMDLRFQWLMEGRKPDANTINDFRKDNIEGIKAAFYEVNRLFQELKLLEVKDYSQDGFKIRAVNSKEKNYTKNKVKDRIKRETKSIKKIQEEQKQLATEQEKVEKYLKGLEIAEELEAKEEKLAKLEEEIEAIESKKEKLMEEEKEIETRKKNTKKC